MRKSLTNQIREEMELAEFYTDKNGPRDILIVIQKWAKYQGYEDFAERLSEEIEGGSL